MEDLIIRKPVVSVDTKCVERCPPKTHSKAKVMKDFNIKNICKYGIVLKKSGIYKFTRDVVFKSKYEIPAITISCSNITLDFGIYSLRQKRQNVINYGILIDRDVENITITGTNKVSIEDFTLAGIRVLGRTQNIRIENLIISNKESRQILNEDLPVECKDIINYPLCLGIAIGEGDTGHLAMKNTDRINTVSGVVLTHVVCRKATIGCQMVFTEGIDIQNSNFIENTYYGLLCGYSWLIRGLPGKVAFPCASNGKINNCRFDNNKGLNENLSNPGNLYVFDFVSGIGLYGCQNFTVENSSCDDNSNNGYILAADHDGSHNCVWKNCTFIRNRSENSTCDGLHFSGSVPRTISSCQGDLLPLSPCINISVSYCFSSDNSGLSGNGFVMAYCNGFKMKNCVSIGNTSNGFRIIGSLPSGEIYGVALEDCTAENNGGRENISSGIYIQGVGKNVVIKNCILNGNMGQNFSAGIIGNGKIENVDITGCIVNGNGSGILMKNIEKLVLENNKSNFNTGDGIDVEKINGCVIKNNCVDFNKIGIKVDGSYLVAGNVAYGNKSNYSGVNNVVTVDFENLPSSIGMKNISVL